MSTVSLFNTQQAFRSSPLGQVSPLVARSMVAGRTLKTRHFSSYELSLCAGSYPALQRSHNTGSVVSSHSSPPFTGSRECSDQLSFATAECDLRLLFCSMVPRNHDAFPLTLNRSASPAQSESPYVNTEPTGALFTASRLSVVGRIVTIPGFPRKYRRIDLMFLMSVLLARPRLDEGFPVAQLKPARSIHNSFPRSCRETFCSLASISFSSFSRRSHRSVCELLSDGMLNSSSMRSCTLFRFFTRVRSR